MRNNDELNDSKSSGIGKWIAGGVMAGLMAMNGFLFWRTNDMEAKMARMQSATQAEVAALRDSTANAAMAMRKSVDELSLQFEDRAKQANASTTKSVASAQKNTERLVRQLAEQQKAHAEQLAAQLGEVKNATESSAAKMSGIESSVGSVKTEVAQTKSQVDQALADLRSVRGDLGVQSGLIATNSKELAALRDLGERNYYEFTINKKDAQSIKVAGVTVTLKKADPKRNKFNLEILADDRKVEKKDKTINEPVQFYVSGARQPYEIVVNDVKKDIVVGYLASPKTIQSRR